MAHRLSSPFLSPAPRFDGSAFSPYVLDTRQIDAIFADDEDALDASPRREKLSFDQIDPAELSLVRPRSVLAPA